MAADEAERNVQMAKWGRGTLLLAEEIGVARKSSTGAIAIAFTQSLTTTWPEAGNLAIR